jgi:hypothetical protein
LAIQVCVGHFPDGRERHRTFSLKNIKPDADAAALIAVIRAVGSLLAHPVTHARLIVKERRVLFDATKPDAPAGDTEICASNPASETPGKTPETPPRETKPLAAGARTKSVFAEPAEPIKLTKTAADACLFFKIFKKFLAVFRRPYQKCRQ